MRLKVSADLQFMWNRMYSMEDAFSIRHGSHWVNKRPYPCPRICLDEECQMCQKFFDLIQEIPKQDQAKRDVVRRQWGCSAQWLVNIYFPHSKVNPEELRGRTMFFNSPKTVFDMWFAALYRDDPGDPQDPSAFGAFFDPENAFLFQLEVLPNGNNNGYKSSKFLGNLGPHPIAFTDKNGTKVPDKKAISAILDGRHDLFTKVDEVNPKKIRQLAIMLESGVSESDLENEPQADDDGPELGKGASAIADEKPDESEAPTPSPKNKKKPPTPIDEGDETPAKAASIDDEGGDKTAITKPPAKAASIDDDDDTPTTKAPAAASIDDDDDNENADPGAIAGLLDKLRTSV